VVLSSTFHQGGDLIYGRDGNPTWSALEEAIGGLEGGSAKVFASGMAAVAAVLEMLPVPGRVVVAGDAYNGVRRFLGDVAARGRIVFRTVDISDTDATLAACAEVVGEEHPNASAASSGGGPTALRGEATGRVVDGAGAGLPDRSCRFGEGGVLWLESPTNPLLAVADLEALVAGAHRLGMDVAVDNTFATPLLQRPLDFGADVVIHSATKLLSGHADVVLGAAVSTRSDMMEALENRRSLHGAIAGPWEAWLVLRGMRTLSVRLDRAQANAAELAVRLRDHRAVVAVRYPGLPEHPGHRLAARQMRGFGTMVAFDVAGGAVVAEAVTNAVRLATAGTSLGGVETLIERRARWSGEQALPPGLLRLSVGIEDVEDLWRDLDAALQSASR
jgi:cystathionine gamma-synthase